MTQTLSIEGFLGIRKAEVELRGLSLIIGEQASGKSIVARLFYFFNKYFSDFDEISLINNEHKKTYDKRKKDEFYQIFPPYSWEGDSFQISYSVDGYQACISSEKNSSVIDVSTSPSVAKYFRDLKHNFKQFVDSFPEEESLARTRLLREFRHVESQSQLFRFQTALFVPAARSFYATLRDEIFSILALDTKIDQIILQFGEFYEGAKVFGGRVMPSGRYATRALRVREERDIFKKVVKGEYVREDARDWIQMDRGRIELSKASSGQQEATPLIFAISRFPSPGRTLIIEEPEAHLFPDAQVAILEFMIRQSLARETSILFTTHSPYLLTALNNFILASEVGEQGGIDVESVSAYALRGGYSHDIVDRNENIISADYIDSVSDDLNEKFSNLLDKYDS
ncbi:AAA family ATPase [Rhodovulum sp. P5]|uniref:AAA family ATPase n=1 Tax=Rhodovulum sp. P5 TaxID=1564506 RepID=UPI0009D999D3|nr:ATP-binding protein [Rhodovulum sp. P5]